MSGYGAPRRRDRHRHPFWRRPASPGGKQQAEHDWTTDHLWRRDLCKRFLDRRPRLRRHGRACRQPNAGLSSRLDHDHNSTAHATLRWQPRKLYGRPRTHVLYVTAENGRWNALLDDGCGQIERGAVHRPSRGRSMRLTQFAFLWSGCRLLASSCKQRQTQQRHAHDHQADALALIHSAASLFDNGRSTPVNLALRRRAHSLPSIGRSLRPAGIPGSRSGRRTGRPAVAPSHRCRRRDAPSPHHPAGWVAG